jgi:glucose/arabinose dehydrogenase
MCPRTRRSVRVSPEALESRLLFTVPAGFTETRVATNLAQPVAMDLAPDGRIFVTEKAGAVRVIRDGQVLPAPFARFDVATEGERGMSGVEFDPDFARNGYVYVYYTAKSPVLHNRLSRLKAADADPDPDAYRPGDVMQPGGETVLMDLDPIRNIYHMSGAVHFGPDGKLYVTSGDNVQGVVAQKLDTVLGKVLRLNPDGTIPSDNPFYNQTTGKNRAIWAYGLRNPFTFGFQPGTGLMYINEVGDYTYEEIDQGRRGANYGWPNTEGPTTDPRFDAPVYAYRHNPGCAVTGGAFYNPDAGATRPFPSDYVGDWYWGDLCEGKIRRLDPQTHQVTGFASNLQRPVDVDIAADGSMYYLANARAGGVGHVFRISYTGSAAPGIGTQPASRTVSVGQSATFSVSASGAAPLSYQWQRQPAGASAFSDVAGATGSSYTLASAALADNGSKFRVVVRNAAGSVTSSAATLAVTANRPPVAKITAPPSGTLYAAGQTITFSGTGTDPEDGALPASRYTWEVAFHHDTHTHPFVEPFSGSTGGTFTVPTEGETSPNVWYRIHLTVTDSAGLSTTVTRDVKPRKATATLATSVPGLKLTLDGVPVTAPRAVTGVVGMHRTLGAPSTQVLSGKTYEFVSWSDGGAATHDISFPPADRTYTANYLLAGGGGGTGATLSAADDAYVRSGDGAARNYGAAGVLMAKTSADANVFRQSYLKFDLAGVTLSAGATAKLRLFGQYDAPAGSTETVAVGVFGVPESAWSESSLTWNTRPGAGGTTPAAAAAQTLGVGPRWYQWDLTDYLRQQQAAGKRFVTLLVKTTAARRYTASFNSAEAASNGPQLVIGS